ncbi:type II-A CRISPR-associated protein Csn2 [Streptococcus mutans]|uniref:type II-A CRISPR-associated protein Csn2 n=1 Tax=Streptococcus mutans TaxID=1309 RepID=UPI002284CF8D|nr:type II-A CRISPR-associated protein Csn2 [Streptococcus mutans]MCY7114942.1 type II-A CRISPR-associated protein Csn2 [Streptococcus mutans]MCY7120921.1 type II-A CRISPR-associated protein Csn2 [Streptococcus mutans]MCY7149481.1 type II-A CRISPR-associated protein Csn2 [Streptococcus mutans]
MKLNFPILDEPITLEKSTILVLEDVQVFAQMVRNLYQYDEDSELKFFNRKFKSLKPSELMLVTDILGYDVNAPSLLKLVHADLENQFNEKPEVKSMVEKLVNTITELIAYECLENELDLEYDEITILELIKALGVKIETQSDTIFEKMFEVLQVYKYLNKKKLLVFINTLSYFKREEIAQILEYIHLSDMVVLFIEPRKIDDFAQYILDEDYFLITESNN